MRCLCWSSALLFRSVLLVVDELDLLKPLFSLQLCWILKGPVLWFYSGALLTCLLTLSSAFNSCLFICVFVKLCGYVQKPSNARERAGCGCVFVYYVDICIVTVDVQYDPEEILWCDVCFSLCSPPAVINSKILTVTVRPEPQPSEPMVVVELSQLLNVSKRSHFPPNCFHVGICPVQICIFF